MCDSQTSADAVPPKLLALMLQCSIQAQLSYYNEFKNEIRSRWLEAFLGHNHLEVKRMSDRGGGVLQYRGFSNGLKCSHDDYLKTMLSGKPEKYQVRYKIGTADTFTAPSPPETPETPAAAEGDGGGITGAPWAAASASRAANPYLQKSAQYREYSEIIEPSRVASGLMSICGQLAEEWADDLGFIAREGALLYNACLDAEEECRFEEEEDVATGGLFAEATSADATGAAGKTLAEAIANPLERLPDVLSESYRAARMVWTSDLAEPSSPFRGENYDLLQRCVTREAAISAMQTLKAERGDDDASAEWLRAKLVDEWLPRFENPVRTHLAGLFLVELVQASPTPVQREASDGETSLSIIDPDVVAREVVRQRERIARAWASEVEQVPAVHAALLREHLEGQLAQDEGSGSGRDEDE